MSLRPLPVLVILLALAAAITLVVGRDPGPAASTSAQGDAPPTDSTPVLRGRPTDGEPEGAAWIAGRVVDDATGEPVAHFTVRMESRGRRAPRFGPDPVPPPRELPDGLHVSGEDGRWSLSDPGLVVELMYRVVVEAEGFLPSRARVAATSVRDPDGSEIRLRRSGAVRGIVVDGQGASLEGARVRAVPGERDPVPTDPGGHFQLDEVAAGTVQILVTHPEHVAAEHGPFVVPANDTLDVGVLPMPRPGFLVAYVRDGAGRPVAGQVVLASREHVTEDVAVLTDAQGRAAFDTLAGGSWVVRRLLPSPFFRTVQLGGGAAQDVSLFPTGSGRVSGVLRSPSGRSVSIALTPVDPDAGLPTAWVDPDDDGRFTFEDVEAGTYTVSPNLTLAPELEDPPRPPPPTVTVGATSNLYVELEIP